MKLFLYLQFILLALFVFFIGSIYKEIHAKAGEIQAVLLKTERSHSRIF